MTKTNPSLYSDTTSTPRRPPSTNSSERPPPPVLPSLYEPSPYWRNSSGPGPYGHFPDHHHHSSNSNNPFYTSPPIQPTPHREQSRYNYGHHGHGVAAPYSESRYNQNHESNSSGTYGAAPNHYPATYYGPPSSYFPPLEGGTREGFHSIPSLNQYPTPDPALEKYHQDPLDPTAPYTENGRKRLRHLPPFRYRPYQPIPINTISIPTVDEITDIQPKDVLSGRGGATNNHSGNVEFRTLVEQYKPQYLAAKKIDKPAVASVIVDIIRKRGGRFLQKLLVDGKRPKLDTIGNVIWYDIGDEKAKEKTCQALREGAAELRRRCSHRNYTGLYYDPDDDVLQRKKVDNTNNVPFGPTVSSPSSSGTNEISNTSHTTPLTNERNSITSNQLFDSTNTLNLHQHQHIDSDSDWEWKPPPLGSNSCINDYRDPTFSPQQPTTRTASCSLTDGDDDETTPPMMIQPMMERQLATTAHPLSPCCEPIPIHQLSDYQRDIYYDVFCPPKSFIRRKGKRESTVLYANDYFTDSTR